MYELTDVALVALLLLGGYYLWRGQAVKEVALRAAREHCREMDVQLLDDSVVLRGLWCKRDAGGSLRLWRRYQFEFTATGDDRYQGRVLMLGARLEAVRLDTHRIH